MTTSTERLSVGEKIGYSLGDLAANLIFQTFITFLAFFYTDIYKIPAGTASAVPSALPWSTSRSMHFVPNQKEIGSKAVYKRVLPSLKRLK